uniref:Cystatin domain-containing protein n=1 Tax=Auxenochlorella protothecoides TaxID=3075 RepID=A0A1D2AHG5_AUXPR
MRGLLVTVFLGASLYLFVQPAMTGLLGGFSSKPAGENDARVNQAVDVATKEIKGKHSSSTSISVESVETQVVAGTNYKLRLKASDGDSHTRYEAVVYEELPHAGGKFSLTDLKAIDSPEKDSASSGSGASGSKEAATFAVQQISSQSNSLMPFALKEIVKSEESKEGGITLHRLKLKLGHTSMDDQTYDVEVASQDKGFELRKSQPTS